MGVVDLWTVGTSVGGSLLVSYIGVRYFTAQRVRAEREVAALEAIEQAVLPLLREARSFAARPGKPSREVGTAFMDDGISALQVLNAARHLPRWRRALVERRCRRVFGAAWVRHALPEVGMPTASSNDQSNRIFVRALFETHDGPGAHVLGTGRPVVTVSDGLMQRTYEGAAEPKRLVGELTRLSQAR